MIPASVLLLADSRLPSGGHVHSGGVEMAVRAGLVDDVPELESFLRGRLRTNGTVLAAFAATGCLLAAEDDTDWETWDRAFSVRTPVPALRDASRAQGGALLRTATRMWHTPALAALRRLGRPHQPLVLGVATAAAGGTPSDAAALATHHLLGGACSAAVRLLGLDPLDVARVQASLAEPAADTAGIGVRAAELAVSTQSADALPSVSGVLPELLAARHAELEVTLFAS